MTEHLALHVPITAVTQAVLIDWLIRDLTPLALDAADVSLCAESLRAAPAITARTLQRPTRLRGYLPPCRQAADAADWAWGDTGWRLGPRAFMAYPSALPQELRWAAAWARIASRPVHRRFIGRQSAGELAYQCAVSCAQIISAEGDTDAFRALAKRHYEALMSALFTIEGVGVAADDEPSGGYVLALPASEVGDAGPV